MTLSEWVICEKKLKEEEIIRLFELKKTVIGLVGERLLKEDI